MLHGGEADGEDVVAGSGNCMFVQDAQSLTLPVIVQ